MGKNKVEREICVVVVVRTKIESQPKKKIRPRSMCDFLTLERFFSHDQNFIPRDEELKNFPCISLLRNPFSIAFLQKTTLNFFFEKIPSLKEKSKNFKILQVLAILSHYFNKWVVHRSVFPRKILGLKNLALPFRFLKESF